MRVVAGIVQNAHAEQIRFFLCAARHFQESQAGRHPNTLLRNLSGRTAQQHARRDLTQSGNQTHFLLLRRIAHGVLQHNVGNLMRHHARQLGLRSRRLNCA